MKTIKRGVVALIVAVSVAPLCFTSPAQTNVDTIQLGDFIVPVVSLQRVARNSVPDSGNFWILSVCEEQGQGALPCPFDTLPRFRVYS